MYVPETHPVTGNEYHEKEYFAHLLKGMSTCFRSIIYSICYNYMAESTRLGGPNNLRYETFTETLFNEISGLTYPAITGQHKQSFQDAELLFFEGVHQFILKHNYTCKANNYVRII